MTLYVEEKWVDRTSNSINGESGLYEPFTEDKKKLFQAFQRQYGKCVSKVYVDTKEGTKAIGWVFEKLQKYDDCNEKFLLETWVTLHDDYPEVHTTYHYHEIAK